METVNTQQFSGEIRTGRGTLGKPRQKSANEPQADSFLPDDFFDKRQADVGVRRNYAGPLSEGGANDFMAESFHPETIPPTDCAEPDETAESE